MPEGATLALASFLRKQGRDDEAVRLIEEFQGRNPASIGALVLLLSLYAASGSDQLESFLQKNEEQFVRPSADGEATGQASAMPWQ